jgi:hypothetical protein
VNHVAALSSICRSRGSRSVVLLLIGALVLPACGGSKPNRTVNAHAKGVLDAAVTLTAHISTSYETTYPNGGKVGQSASLDWSLTWNGELPFTGGNVPFANAVWKVNKMTGTVSWHGTGPNGPLSCSGTLTETPGISQDQLRPLLDAQSSFSPGHYDLVGAVPTASQLVSSDTNPADTQCNTSIAVDYLQNGPAQGSVSAAIMNGWKTLIAPRTTAALSKPGKFDPPSFSFHWSGPQPPVNGATTTLTDDGSWTFS